MVYRNKYKMFHKAFRVVIKKLEIFNAFYGCVFFSQIFILFIDINN